MTVTKKVFVEPILQEEASLASLTLTPAQLVSGNQVP